ncbi:unnamed protein product, partial [Rotaria magnacalcarata]
NEKQSEYTFSRFAAHITLGFQSDVSTFIYSQVWAYSVKSNLPSNHRLVEF